MAGRDREGDRVWDRNTQRAWDRNCIVVKVSLEVSVMGNSLCTRVSAPRMGTSFGIVTTSP